MVARCDALKLARAAPKWKQGGLHEKLGASLRSIQRAAWSKASGALGRKSVGKLDAINYVKWLTI
jgi:hypothetical protein